MTQATVVIPARNAARTIGWTLAGLAQQDFVGDWEVIVLDDGSTDSTRDVVRAFPLDLRLVELEGNGAASARNVGVSLAKGDRIAFLDSDCRPAPGWLGAGIEALGSADLVQGATFPDPEPRRGPFDRSLWVGRPSPLFESANLFVRRDLFDAIGGFEQWISHRNGRPLGEDVLFGWSARRAEAKVRFSEQAVVHHAVFRGSMWGYVRERARLRFFPAMARRVPELRKEFFFARWFLSRRSAAFDLAVIGCATALRTRDRLALLALGPYLLAISGRIEGSPQHRLKMGVAEISADLVGFMALLAGSVQSGQLVL